MERVVTVLINDEARAYSFERLAEKGVAHDEVGGRELVIFWKAGTNSPLAEQQIALATDIGTTAVFDRNLDGQRLTFEPGDDGFVDTQTGRRGTCSAGP